MVLRKLKPCKTCGDPSYIWAHGNCKNCDGMLRAKDEQKKPIAMPVKKPFKAISDKQAKRLAKYRIVRDEFLKEHPTCQYPGCVSALVELHHQMGRCGELLYNPAHFVSLCRQHHLIVEQSPLEAKILGLSKSRLDK